MKGLPCSIVIAMALMSGCKAFDPPTCSNSCFSKPGQFQNCQNCKCTDAQKHEPRHVCCEGADCANNNTQTMCGYPDDKLLHLAIVNLIPTPVLPAVGEHFSIGWQYQNLSSGSLRTPDYYGKSDVILRLHEVNESSTDVTQSVKWHEDVACANQSKSADYPSGLHPTAPNTAGTYSMSFDNLEEVYGANGGQFDVGFGS